MKTSVFFILCAAWLFASLPQFTQAQTLRQTACGTLEVDAETTPADRAYVGGLFTPHCFPNETVLINGARVPAFSYTLFRLPPGGGQVAVTNRQTDASRTSFSNLAPGRYYVRVSATTYLSRRAVNTECNPVGFQAASSPNITSTNNAIVGDPVPQISLEDSYCCGEDVILNTNGTEGNNEYMITICQKANPNDAGCINWNGTGWIVGAVPTELNLLEVWNINQGWPFWPGYYYEVMLAVQNNCSSWEATRETFFVNAPETQFTIRNDNGAIVQDGGTICASAMPPVMDPSGSSCGSKYIVIICQYLPQNPDFCINWKSSGWIEGDVGKVDEINLLDVWRGGNPGNGWSFWPGYDYAVSLVQSSPCDGWAIEEFSFSALGNCLHGGYGGVDRSANAESEAEAAQIKIYPTLVGGGDDFLNVEVPKADRDLLLFDLQGRLLDRMPLGEGFNQMAIGERSNGIYFAVVQGAEGIISNTKIVVNR
ncbi:MAG: hypothetical protein AAFW73_12370 [Bacteroidota bacterium]